ncbi:hypothetical protein GCM10009085_01300 [Pseudomonas avellanae]|nr:hypothetical protein GCM10009085_01300 [Pseudomonas avellanae]
MPVQTTPVKLSHTYAQALEQAHDGKPGAARVLYQQLARTDLSDEQRITLLAELSDYPSPQALKLLDAGLGNASDQVRKAAIDASVKLVSNSQRSLLLGPLLDDPEQSVRFHATRALLGLSPDELGPVLRRPATKCRGVSGVAQKPAAGCSEPAATGQTVSADRRP